MADKKTTDDNSTQDGVFYAPWERSFSRILTPFEEFIHRQTTSGILLMIMAALALFLANSGFSDAYGNLKHTYLSLGAGSWELKKTLHHWVNDGLMVMFFFVIGLELKREMLAGELADIRKAALPIAAAVGGMVVPALIYYFMNPNSPAASGWGIPMATDIAFALGVLALLAHRVPKALVTFLVALAIVDDLGAVIVIAVFYTETINLQALAIVGALFSLLLVFNFGGIRKTTPYFIVFIFLWYAFLLSGVHATLAGVIAAFAIPSRPKYSAKCLHERIKGMLPKLKAGYQHDQNIMKNTELQGIVRSLEGSTQDVQTMLQRLERNWHMPVAYIVIPVFVLINAGIPVQLASIGQTLTHPVALGISLGLVLGKFVGVAGMSWIFLKLGLARLPEGVRFTQIAGVSLLAGIGFTMSIFIAELAFKNEAELLLVAKTGIMFSSLIAGITGSIWLFIVSKKDNKGVL